MTQRTLTADIIAAEAITILDNELVMAKQVFRGYEDDFSKKVNGYKTGETISIRKPTDFTVRDGATMDVQEVNEGKTTITVDKRKGIDFRFSSQELTLNIGELSERVIKPAMVQLANQVDTDLMALYKDIPSWVGTPASPINSYADFAKAPERLDEYAVPSERASVLSPADHWGLLGSQTALYMQDVAKGAYRKGALGMIGGVDTYMSQNVPTHTVGVWAGTNVEVDQSVTASTITYDAVKDTNVQTITVDGFTAASPVVSVGDVFEIEDVYAVNPVTKARLPFRKQFTVVSAVSGASNHLDITFSPAMIWTGAFKNIDVASGVTDLNNKDVIPVGVDSTNYRQNMVFHKNAFALVTVPLVSPPGAVDVARKSYKGLNVRVIPVYDGVNDTSAWRLDLLYGCKTIDPRLATRVSGTT
jgi:hypothetical protein